MKNFRGMMIGAGFFARFQAEAWRRVSGAEIVAVSDPVRGRAKAFAKRWGIARAYSATEEMLDKERVDFVDIVTRSETHFDLVERAADRKFNIICQKPMAPAWDECTAMVRRCESAGVRLLIHENWRWHPWYREVKRLLEQGRFGRPFQLSLLWRTGDGRGPAPYQDQPYCREMPKLLVYDTLVHALDMYRFVIGEFRCIFCQIRRINPVIRGEDQAIIQIESASGTAGLIDANRISGQTPAEIAISQLHLEGERASMRMTPDGRLWISEYDQPEIEHRYPIPTEGFRGDSVRSTQQHLIDCLRSDTPCDTEGREYLQTMRAAFACYESAELGGMIKLR